MTASAAQPLTAATTARANPRAIARGWPAALVVISLAVAAAVGTPAPDEPAAPATVTYTATDFGRRASHDGRYLAEVVGVDGAAPAGQDRWIVRLTRRNHRRVANARVAARVWMPDDSTLAPSRASVRYLGGGRYAIEPVTISRAGWWNLDLVVDGVAGTDSVAFNVIRGK